MPESAGSAATQASLWSRRARDWAEVMEGWAGWGVPVYRHVVERVTVGPGTALLDVGCGAGRFSRLAADRGATVSGLDATEAFVEIARERVPDADIRVGEMEELPWADDSFDVVTGFNSFFIADDMVNALREAARVLAPGGSLATTVFGRPERCQSTAVFATLPGLMGAPPPGAAKEPGEPDPGPRLHEEGTLEAAAAGAGLTPTEAGYFSFAEEFPDLDTMLRGYMAAPPFVRAAQAAGEDQVRATLTEAFEPLRTGSGRYRLDEEVRYLIATA
jgi:SAM-dependent methyltransferase